MDNLLEQLQRFIHDAAVIERAARVRLYHTAEADKPQRQRSELIIRHAVGLRRSLEACQPARK